MTVIPTAIPATVPPPSYSGRLFFAIPLSEPVRAALALHLSNALGGQPIPGRRVAPENWHLTLRFLGETDPARGARLVQALGDGELGPAFTIGFDTLGAFPRAQRAQALWLGVERGVPELRRLAAVVEQAVVRSGFAPDDRRFAAHLTLSRLRPPADVRAVIAAVPRFTLPLAVDRVVLFHSRLDRQGPTYSALAAFLLDPGQP